MIHTAVSRDSTSFNTGTTSQHPSWSHHHTLITFLSGCKKYSTKGLTMAWKAVKFKKRKIRWMSAHYRQNLAPEILAEFGHFILNLNWLGWIPTKHLKESASWKTLANHWRRYIRLMILMVWLLCKGVVEYLRLRAFWEDSINGLRKAIYGSKK